MADYLKDLPDDFNPGPLDLDQPLDNQVALLKLQADLSGADVQGGFGGKAWAWLPGKENILLFNTYGIGCSRLEYDRESHSWHFSHREALFYLDPVTNEVLKTWKNPMTGKTVEVIPILNDPVNRIYPIEGGRFAPPYPYVVNGDNLVFQVDVLRAEHNTMSRAEYPLHSQQDVYQSGELWAIRGSLAEINDPERTSASCHTAWGRLAMWLPFMEMGDTPGFMIYHSQSFKLANGWQDLPEHIHSYVEQNHPIYFKAPEKFLGMAANDNSWTYSKKIIDKRRKEAGLGFADSVFEID